MRFARSSNRSSFPPFRSTARDGHVILRRTPAGKAWQAFMRTDTRAASKWPPQCRVHRPYPRRVASPLRLVRLLAERSGSSCTSRAARAPARDVLRRKDARRGHPHAALPRHPDRARRRHRRNGIGWLFPPRPGGHLRRRNGGGPDLARASHLGASIRGDPQRCRWRGDGRGERQPLPPALPAAAAGRVYGSMALARVGRPNSAEPCDGDGARYSVGAPHRDDQTSGVSGSSDASRCECPIPWDWELKVLLCPPAAAADR